MRTITDRLGESLEISWTCATSEKDWLRIQSMIEGMQNALIYLPEDNHELLNKIDDDLNLLWCIAGEHFLTA